MTEPPAMRHPGPGETLLSTTQPVGTSSVATVRAPALAGIPTAETVVPEAAGLHRIVVVGGGAGGLELATRLGDTLGKRKRAHITLIEKQRTHFWKPHLHQIAAGSMDIGVYETNYLAQAHWHHFRYRIGEMTGLDRERRHVIVAPFVDEDGDRVTPKRRFGYDTLVMALGSLTNDFGTPGAREHAISLETAGEAQRFHRRLVNACIRAFAQGEPLLSHQLTVAIIGAGATGVELAAELHNTTRTLVSFGFDRIDPDKDVKLIVIEAADRVLPALPPRLSTAAMRLLKNLNISVRTSARVAEVVPQGVKLASGEVIPAELVVWAAGVKAPEFLKDLDGLETNRINQLVVFPTLQTTRDENIFAIGDCAACPWLGKPEGMTVPPRAQSAHQQASHMLKQLKRRLAGEALTEWRYRDFGSLVSLGEYSTVGNLMGALVGKNLWLEGGFAKLMYLSLYKMHELALHGWWKVSLDTAARVITRRTEPHVKLH
ncbi:MAG TPA: NAD(P)/FAD-dependent oxidoreductase [Casimicrobiaceae bacterium]|nr:NAD(P)/FAD-dependent oxidoreductase [Casimicrobiaceae bacterium]